MNRLSYFVASTVLLAACGGGGTTTSPTDAPGETSFLTGTWRGPATIHREGLPDSTAATTWTFTLVPNTGRSTFTTKLTAQDAWLPISATLSTGVSPVTPGGHINTVGSYTSPRGCQGTIASFGTAYQDRIEASFEGVDCPQLPATAVFNGSVTLTKEGR